MLATNLIQDIDEASNFATVVYNNVFRKAQFMLRLKSNGIISI